MKACRPPGTTVAGPLPKKCPRSMLSAILSSRMPSRNSLPCGPRIHHQHREMILQILSDRQIDDRLDADRTQMIGRADAGEHQHLRRVERAAAQDHLARRRCARSTCPPFSYSTPVARLPCMDDARNQRAHLDRQIFPLHRRMQIADRGRAALAVADRILAPSEAHARRAVVVVGHRQARHARGFDPGGEHRVLGLRPLHADVAVRAAEFALAVLPALDALEVRQHVGIGPAARALLRPAVVVGGIAARERHHVDRGRAAEHLAAHLLDAAAVEVRVRLRLVAPVVHLVFVQLAEPDRNVDQRIEVAAAGFEQQHAGVRVFRQPVGQHAAGGAAADDDVVVTVF